MPAFAPKYSAAQKDSIAIAIVERRQGVKVAQDACRLAAAGELENVNHKGERLAAFEMPITTVRKLAGDERRRRNGETVPEWIRGKGPDAAIDELAVRLVAIASGEVDRILHQTGGKRDLDRLRKAGQVLREARALVRGDAPKQGSAQRRARAGEPSGDGTASAGAAEMVREMRDAYGGDDPRTDAMPPEQGDTETDGPTEPTRTHADADGSGINTGAGSARDAERAQVARELGIEQAKQS